MGHNVRYYGKLTVKNPLSDAEIALFKQLQNDDRNYDRLYALEYQDGYFQFRDCEKIYPTEFYEKIEKYIEALKEGGNDLVDGSFLVSSSEYGIDEEAILLLYTNGAFIQKPITGLVEDFIKITINNFQKTIVDEGQKHEGKEHKIHKSLNAATLLVNIMLEQNNFSSKTESNNRNPIDQTSMIIESWDKNNNN